ncbi:chemotaxis protein CheW [Halobacillus salinarum]|uniref:Chemotaxis protein CheW n=1 Tax=Halobacillus salinarum TaxID=2932257 RepID=A0ABY4EHB5_9BACI|nr:chemotaxis protein CheW [Halobacillus salinarum]UOQ43034.1 chemotaxis protein CheW [Halobacillus salinarum]
MTEEAVKQTKVIVFQLKDEEYAIPVENVGSIERLLPITRVPKTAEFVEGVINLRGVVTPIIDLRKRFNLEASEHDEQTRIIVSSIADMDVGLIVDSANDVLDLKEDDIEPPPEVVGTVEVEYIRGVAKLERRLLILLDLEMVLNQKEVQKLMEIEG